MILSVHFERAKHVVSASTKVSGKLFVGNLHAEIPRERHGSQRSFKIVQTVCLQFLRFICAEMLRLSQVFGEWGRVVNVHAAALLHRCQMLYGI